MFALDLYAPAVFDLGEPLDPQPRDADQVPATVVPEGWEPSEPPF